jgi:hypothetical protein
VNKKKGKKKTPIFLHYIEIELTKRTKWRCFFGFIKEILTNEITPLF